MIRAEDVLPSGIECRFINYLERDRDEYQHRLRPPPVEFSHQSEFFWKQNWNQQQEEKDNKKQGEYYQAVKGVEASDQFHGWVFFSEEVDFERINGKDIDAPLL